MGRYEEDIDAPQEIDLAEGSEPDLEECPNCGESIAESASRCPYCGRWVSDSSPAANRSSGWFWPTVVAVLIGIILVLWTGL
jgi:hypothetical protein